MGWPRPLCTASVLHELFHKLVWLHASHPLSVAFGSRALQRPGLHPTQKIQRHREAVRSFMSFPSWHSWFDLLTDTIYSVYEICNTWWFYLQIKFWTSLRFGLRLCSDRIGSVGVVVWLMLVMSSVRGREAEVKETCEWIKNKGRLCLQYVFHFNFSFLKKLCFFKEVKK